MCPYLFLNLSNETNIEHGLVSVFRLSLRMLEKSLKQYVCLYNIHMNRIHCKRKIMLAEILLFSYIRYPYYLLINFKGTENSESQFD